MKGGAALRLRCPFFMALIARCGSVRADNRPMTPTSAPANTHPYESLTPDVVLDALATLDLHGDGRLTALNSCLLYTSDAADE